MGLRPSFSIVIGTFGGLHWRELAEEAKVSAVNQSLTAEIIMSHEDTLHDARNFGAERASGDWLIFLDADDQLDSRYVECMSDRIQELGDGDYLIQPATLGVVDGVEDDFPVLIPPKPSISVGNWMVIGTALKKSTFKRVGGFKDLPCWEDWVLWSDCIFTGSEPVTAEKAIYRVSVNPDGRNNPDLSEVQPALRTVRSTWGEL